MTNRPRSAKRKCWSPFFKIALLSVGLTCLSGCGGSSPSSPGEEITKTEFNACEGAFLYVAPVAGTEKRGEMV